MFGLGLWEIGVIALVIVLFIKPSELPRAARAVGRVVQRVQSASSRARAEMSQVSAALERGDLERDLILPSKEVIHPMQTQSAEEDESVERGYIEKASSGDAVER